MRLTDADLGNVRPSPENARGALHSTAASSFNLTTSIKEMIGGLSWYRLNPFQTVQETLEKGRISGDKTASAVASASTSLHDDSLIGGDGNDRLFGGAGADSIVGGAGNDKLFGRGGADWLFGGAGDDTLIADADDITIDGGDGFDKLFIRGGEGFAGDLAALNIEWARGGVGDDALDGAALLANTSLAGGDGDDTLTGGAGNDRLHGDAGDDVIVSGAGNDRIKGGSGADTFIQDADAGLDVIRDFESGVDTLVFVGTGASYDDLVFTTRGTTLLVTLGDKVVRLKGLADQGLSESDVRFEDPASGFVPPDDAGIIDAASFGAIADDGIDDTAAIQAMFSASAGRQTYYFADGVYDISDTITLPTGLGTNVPSFITIQGQSEAGTIFKLADGLGHEGPILAYPGSVAQAFNNRIKDVTFDIGVGNTDATGLQFAGNNQSTIKNVTITSGEGGFRGLDLVAQSEFGPALIEDVTVIGFETGIATAFQVNSATFEDITLVGQETGFSSILSHVAFLRGIDYTGPGVAVANASFSRMVLLDSEFRSSDETIEDQVAVFNLLSFYGDNIRAEGFDLTIDSRALTFQANGDIATPDSDEYIGFGSADRGRGGAFNLFESPDTSIGLQVEETPETSLDTNDGSWVSIAEFGAVEGEDATAAFQAAIDSGATTVYLPDGDWTFDEVVVRGDVEQIVAFGRAFIQPGATLRIADGSSDTVIVEGLRTVFSQDITEIQHDTDRTLVLRDMTAMTYNATAGAAGEEQGDVFFANIVADSINLNNQRAWARQLNVEGNNADKGLEAKIINDGGDFWVLGLKTEGEGTVVKTENGGRSEVFGSYHNGFTDFDAARFVTEDASLFATITEASTSAQDFDLVRETRDGVTREGRIKQDGRADVYSAYDASVIADRLIIVDNDQADLSGAWQDAGPAFPGGFLGDNFLFAEGGSDAAIKYTATALTDGSYVVSLRDIEDWPGQLHTGHTRDVDITFGAGEQVFVLENVDMVDAPGLWETLGTVDVQAGDELFVEFDAAGVEGKIIADAVRFERLDETVEDVNQVNQTDFIL